MDDEQIVVLMDLVELCLSNSETALRILTVTGDVAMKPSEKDERTQIIRSIQITQDGCKKTFGRIEALRKK